MIYFLHNLITSYIYFYPVKVCIVILILLIWFVIYKLVKFKVSTNYKIYTPGLNWVFVLAYLSIYIIYIIILRYFAWGNVVSLKELYILVKPYFISVSFLYISLIVSISLLCVILLIRLRTILTKELIKRHIWFLYDKQCAETTYRKFLGEFKAKYSFRELINYKCRTFIYTKGLVLLYKIFTNKVIIIFVENLLDKLSSNIWKFITILPKLILMLLIIYDCYFNSWVITKVFYYLPFYMLFNIWYNISEFLCGNHMQFDLIIYERYYRYEIIIYFDTSDKNEALLKTYIQKGFKYTYSDEDLYMDIHHIIYYDRYVRIEDFPRNLQFENQYSGRRTIMTSEEFEKYVNSEET